ncbi:MAG: hypothetical protein IPI77_22295 [Saprospiraceae bacterium]|nr:hypothetical protein [Saprospiraceae bacterium]
MVSKLLLSCILLICICCKSKVPDPLIATTAQGGVYTTEQAVSVAMLYSTACASCHGPAGRGYRRRPSPDRQFVFYRNGKICHWLICLTSPKHHAQKQSPGL